MKRTRSMEYKKSEEARELYLVAMNTWELNKTYNIVVEALEKKAKRGIYDHEKAIDLVYQTLVKEANEWYKKYYSYSFNVQDRFTCACDIVEMMELDGEF